MVRILYKDFLDNPEQYKACQAYWDRLIQDIAESLGQGGEWEHWVPRYYADGITPFEQDGNPIADACSRKLDRAIQIIQYPAVHSLQHRRAV